jgi:hypothetical protein
MMLKRISLVASLLFFLLATNVFAYTNSGTFSKQEKNVVTHISNKSLKAVQSSTVTEPTWKNYVVPVSVFLLIIIIFTGYWFILRSGIKEKA